MRLLIHCTVCVFETDQQNPAPIPVQISASNVYRLTCPEGHETMVVISSQSFELLGEIAVQALVDGYFREAIGSFTASLERAYETYVRAVLKRQTRDQALVDNVWKAVAKQSERQLGLFAGVFTMATGHSPPLLPRRMVELRNDVVHKGHIPTEQEATEFGQSVADIAIQLAVDLQHRCREEVRELIGQAQTRDLKHVEELGSKGVTFMGYDFPYGLDVDDGRPQVDIAAAVAGRRWQRNDIPRRL